MQINTEFFNFSNYSKAKFSTNIKSKKEKEEDRVKFQETIQRKYGIEPEEPFEPELSVELDTYEVTEQDRINMKVNYIAEKLKSGAELSDKELDYLSKYSPGQYELAMQAKKERESYEREAKNCKTKSDVNKLKNRKDQHFLSNIKIAEKNGDTAEALKQGILLNQVTDEHKQFLKTKEYKELPNKRDTEEFTNPSLI